MKKTILGLVAVLAFGFVGAQTISFDKTTIDYGQVKFDSDGHRYFTVTNTGDKPLIISEVKAGCGCTTPEWSKDPIAPKKSAQIKVGYNTKLRGAFTKNIEVYSNDPKNERSVLYITGTIEDPTANPNVAKAGKPTLVTKAEEFKPTAAPAMKLEAATTESVSSQRKATARKVKASERKASN